MNEVRAREPVHISEVCGDFFWKMFCRQFEEYLEAGAFGIVRVSTEAEELPPLLLWTIEEMGWRIAEDRVIEMGDIPEDR